MLAAQTRISAQVCNPERLQRSKKINKTDHLIIKPEQEQTFHDENHKCHISTRPPVEVDDALILN